MSDADALLLTTWLGLTLYALLGGADFGAGFWDLLAGGARRGRAQRDLIEHSIGPVWEANHVWLIFVIVLFWTGFPRGFAPFAATLYIPLTLAALGIIARGSAFAFRKASEELWLQRLFGAAFALSSIITPFFLGAVADAVASRRVPPDIVRGDIIGSWANPTSVTIGVLAVGATAYLCHNAMRLREVPLAEAFRRRALANGVVVGLMTVGALVIVRSDAPDLYAGLTGRALPVALLSVLAGMASLGLLLARRYVLARITAGLAVAAVIWAWGVAQYPVVLPGLTVDDAAGHPVTPAVLLRVTAIGAIVLVPSLLLLFAVFQRDLTASRGERARAGSGPR